MSDEELIREWTETKMKAVGLVDGMKAPMYPPDHQKRHPEAKAELLRRGFVEAFLGVWERPSGAGR